MARIQVVNENESQCKVGILHTGTIFTRGTVEFMLCDQRNTPVMIPDPGVNVVAMDFTNGQLEVMSAETLVEPLPESCKIILNNVNLPDLKSEGHTQ